MASVTKTETESSATVAVTRLAKYGFVAALVASGANGLVRVIASLLFGVSTAFEPLGWGPIVTTTVAGVVGATVAYGLLLRVSTRPDRTFPLVAAVVLLLSFVPLLAPPAFLADAPRSVLVTLAVMHVTTAAAAVGVLPRARDSGADSR